MALTEFQRTVCRLIAKNRLVTEGSYVAGGAALNTLLDAPRLSRDIDLFHDTVEALRVSWERDRLLLLENGFEISLIRQSEAYVEALVGKEGQEVLLQWVRDSAFRFFPLQPDDELGAVLHPFDLATNKVLALVGRLEVRDWIDVQTCSDKLQHLGLLAWAACGKDPGFSPDAILSEARRSSHYTAEEILPLDFDGDPPDIVQLSRRWKTLMSEADTIIGMLPAEEAGRCVLNAAGVLFSGSVAELAAAVNKGGLTYHRGTIGGVLPQPGVR